VYPPLWVTDGGLMSEGLFAVLTAAIVVLSYRVAARPSPQRAAGLGLAIGLAMLTRDEAVLLLFVLVLPLVVTVRHRGGRQVALLVVSVVVATGATVSPWVIRNLVTFQRPVLMSTDDGTLHGANCPPTYYGAGIGTWSPTCPLPGPAAHGDESVQDEAARQAGLTYVGHHLSRLPVVVAARVGRLWEVYQPVRDADANGDDGRPQWANTACLWAYAALVPIAGVGLVLLVRRGQSVLPLVAQLAAVTLTAALVWGAVRFRVPADVVLVVFGGVALDAPGRFGVSHVRRRRSGCHERAASARARRLSSSSSGSDM
ncbi:MAG TPA: hypothetical protein VG435_10325, partial [Acidimicrobiales bacterium]|nr:hypothetical protein [Acidimicrobiales bacterium]